VLAGAATAYFGVRGVTEGSAALATRHAHLLIGVERFLHLDWERSLQGLVVDSPAATAVLNWIYIYGHWPVIAVTLVWLAVRHREIYRRARNAILASGAVGLVIFAAVPVAPPRLVDPGLVDTVTVQSDAYRVLQPGAFTNQYAALPSLHVGWNLIIGLAIAAAATHWSMRALAFAMTLSMDAAVVLTANHYVLDVVAGATLSAGAWLVVAWLGSRRWGLGPPRPRAVPPPAQDAVPMSRPGAAGRGDRAA
jgi:hypothetical protein